MKVAGVEQIVDNPGSILPTGFAPLGGISVVANNTWAAIQGRDKLKIEWEGGPHADIDTKAYEAKMRETASSPGKVLRVQGDPETAFSEAVKVITADYYQPYIVHAQMERMAL